MFIFVLRARCTSQTISLLRTQQRGVAAGCGGVDRHHLLGGKAAKVVRTARLWPGARERRTAEWLSANHRADHAAVDVDVAVHQPRGNLVRYGIDAGVDAE